MCFTNETQIMTTFRSILIFLKNHWNKKRNNGRPKKKKMEVIFSRFLFTKMMVLHKDYWWITYAEISFNSVREQWRTSFVMTVHFYFDEIDCFLSKKLFDWNNLCVPHEFTNHLEKIPSRYFGLDNVLDMKVYKIKFFLDFVKLHFQCLISINIRVVGWYCNISYMNGWEE